MKVVRIVHSNQFSNRAYSFGEKRHQAKKIKHMLLVESKKVGEFTTRHG